eukprot:5379080-Prymnesium_polylepis.1
MLVTALPAAAVVAFDSLSTQWLVLTHPPRWKVVPRRTHPHTTTCLAPEAWARARTPKALDYRRARSCARDARTTRGGVACAPCAPA